jgi:branched-chain amino acid transport system substrate-binding protein
MWGWGVMNQVAIQEAANIRFPMENFIGIWWSGSENDVLPAGDGANGYKALNMHTAGVGLPDLRRPADPCLRRGPRRRRRRSTGTVLYNRGSLRRDAGRRGGARRRRRSTAPPTSPRDDARRHGGAGDRRGASGRMGLACRASDRSSRSAAPTTAATGLGIVQQWDAAAGNWVQITDYIQSDSEVINALIEEDSGAYAAENNIAERCN